MKLILRYLGYILILSSILHIIPITTGLIYQENIDTFIITFLLSITLGAMLIGITQITEYKKTSLTLTKGLTLITLSFIFLPLITSINYLPYFNYYFLDAFFESISGFTTTGLTVFTSLKDLPKSMLIWRAETQWIGGIGIIMVFLFIFSKIQDMKRGEAKSSPNPALLLYKAQGFETKLESGIFRASTRILTIYGFFTLMGIILLYLVGLPVFDAIAMTFTSLSTGGFSVNNTFYSNTLQLIALSILMIIGSTSFLTHNKLIRKKITELLKDYQLRTFLTLLIISIIFCFLAYTNFRTVTFTLISAFTTTGFTIVDVSGLPYFFIGVVTIGMVIGGSIMSTAGGIKIVRFLTLFKSITWFLKKLASPIRAIIPFKIDDKPVEKEDRLIIQTFFFTYILILVLGSLTFLYLGYNFQNSIFQLTSALGTVGLTTMPLHNLPWIGKTVLIAAMLLGRLEIFPLLIVLRNFTIWIFKPLAKKT
ncbi:MAG: potassium transporter TrkG [Candidatus Thermoplasmatota archaeon]